MCRCSARRSRSQDILAAVGDAALGVKNTSQWSKDLDNPANAQFVAAFQGPYGRLPSLYASQGYDAARLIGSRSQKPGSTIRMRSAPLSGGRVRIGARRFRVRPQPPSDPGHLRREVVKEGDDLTNRVVGVAMKDHADAYAAECEM